jgi:hypothetical protein
MERPNPVRCSFDLLFGLTHARESRIPALWRHVNVAFAGLCGRTSKPKRVFHELMFPLFEYNLIVQEFPAWLDCER